MTDVLSEHFKEQAAEALGNATIQESLDRLVNFRQGRVDAIAEYGQERWDALSQSAPRDQTGDTGAPRLLP